MSKLIQILILISLSQVLQSCIFEYPDCEDYDSAWKKVDVRFDTSSCPDANPEGMAIFFYPEDGTPPWRFDLQGIEGGMIELPVGKYSIISHNNDTPGLIFDKTDNLTETYVTTRLTDIFSGITTLTRQAIPGGPPEGSEKVLLNPQMLWNGIIDNVEISADDSPQTITIPLRQSVANINVDIREVINLEDVSRISAVITGLAGSLNLYRQKPSGSPAAIPFSLYKSSENALDGKLTSFGRLPDYSEKSWLIVYIWLKDGKRFYYRYDVTDQIESSENPMEINILINGMTIPEADEVTTAPGEGGFDIGVDGWDYVIIDL